MYKKSKNGKRHNKRIVLVTIILVVFSIITLITNRSASSIEIIFKDTIANIEYYIIKAPIQYVTNLFQEYTEMKNVYEENQMLKQELEKLTTESANNEVLTSELNQLKELMNIDYLPTDYNVKYTTVITRDPESWNNEVTINLGSSSGVTEGMAVISAQGMIGTVTNVNQISATVTLLSSENPKTQLPVMILSGDQEYYGLLNRYDLTTKCYSITLLSDVEELEADAKVFTSGLGGSGKSPKGILIGTVNDYTISDDTTESICMVTPSANFDSLNYVAVVQRVNDE